ncbi:MAG TPA: DUF2332 domain-containing protein [Chloroflexia bacterium]|nr:DUF2332 domain-containing protein [Chloroflexia bacterium]
MAESQSNLEKVAERFRRFVTQETASSPLYTRLSLAIAADPLVQKIAAHSQPGQPIPNMLFGAVHYLLLQDSAAPLAAYYPDLASGKARTDDPYPLFQAFCLENRAAIIELLESRLVQTNEVQRCTCLLPAFGLVMQTATDHRLALIEIGPSAGLNLLWDQYYYDYGAAGSYGNPDSPLHLKGVLRGEKRPPFPAQWPTVVSRVGLDLNPLDLRDPQNVLWLRALIWPEHLERAARLQRAIEVDSSNRLDLRAGNALELLPEALEEAPAEATLCLYHSFTLNQFTPQMRQELRMLVADFSQRRPVFMISLESQREAFPLLSLTSFNRGETYEQSLARCDPHGAWLEWQAEL